MGTPITSEMIKELRERTGVGMGKCKEALETTQGDIEKAIDVLRKAGIASAVKKEGRAANEGMIGTLDTPQCIALMEVNAETDFVVRNDRFQQFLHDMLDEVVHTKPSSLEQFKQQKLRKQPGLTVEEARANIVQTIGENIQLRRFLILNKSPNKSIGLYSHHGNKLVTIVEIEGSSAEADLAKDIAMHIAAASPTYLSEKDVPQDILANEKEIAKSQIIGKPENIVNKIVDGKMQAFFDTNCLLLQTYIKNDSLTVGELVKQHAKKTGHPLAVTRFIRWSVGQ